MFIKYKWHDTDRNSIQSEEDMPEELELIPRDEAGYRQMLPDEIGEGYFQYAWSGSSPIISACDLRFRKSLCMEERIKEDDICMLSFCLSSGFEWSLMEAAGNSFSIGEKESCIMMGGTERCISIYSAGHSYRGIGVGFRAEQFSGIMEYLSCSGAVPFMPGSQMILKRYTVTPHVEVILQQIMDCRICGSLRDVYLEGKLLELIAVYLDEMVCQRGNDTGHVPLYAEDLSSLQQAKEVLDRNYVHPLTLSQLSKKVCLNEFKLKVGFKELYGQTVYGYILNKRMELARLLLEQGKFIESFVAEIRFQGRYGKAKETLDNRNYSSSNRDAFCGVLFAHVSLGSGISAEKCRAMEFEPGSGVRILNKHFRKAGLIK